MRTLNTVVATWLWLTAGLGTAVGQVPMTNGGESSSSRDQSLNAQTQVAGARRIELNEKGPTDPVFTNFDRPFLLAQWVCVTGSDLTKSEEAFAALLTDPPSRERCRKVLDDLKRGNGSAPETRIHLAAAVFNRQPLAVQAYNSVTGEACGEPVTGITQGADQVLDFAKLKCGTGDRIDLAVVSAADLAEANRRAVLRTEEQASRLGRVQPSSAAPSEQGRATRELLGQPLAVFSLSFELPSQLLSNAGQSRPPSGGSTASCTTVVRFAIDLDATGVESSRFRNPRRPQFLDPRNSSPAAGYKCAELEFSNQIVTRQLVVTFSGLDPAARPGLTGVRGATVQCQNGQCTAAIRVGPGSPTRVPLAPLYAGYVKTSNGSTSAEAVTFTVSFYDDDREPSFPKGYFSLVQLQYLTERKNGAAWASAATLEAGWAPDLTEFDGKYQMRPDRIELGPPASFRSVSKNDPRVAGNVRLSFKQNLGNRVTTDYEVRLKGGEYGDPDPSVSTTRFRVEVFSLNGAVLSAGRAAVAAPSESIAIAEAGDSVGVRLGRFQVNQLVRKQIRDAVLPTLDTGARRTDREHYTTVAQLTGLGTGNAVLDLYATRGWRSQGRDPRSPEDPAKEFEVTKADREYQTVGGELGWAAAPKLRVTSAHYWSRVSTSRPDGTAAQSSDNGRGWASLTTASWTNFDSGDLAGKRLIDWTFQLRYGAGTEERADPTAVDRQEAYTGESASFAPDVIFLKTLVPAVHQTDAARPALGQRGVLTTGLGNKHYVGLVVNVPRLEAFGQVLKAALGEEAVGDTTASLRLHGYWAKDTKQRLGREADFNLAVEAPKGVKASLTVAAFRPGPGLRDAVTGGADGHLFLQRTLWSIVASVTISAQ